MSDVGPRGQPSNPEPPGRPPFAPPPGTPWNGPPDDAAPAPPPDTVFGGGPDALTPARGRRRWSAWPPVARPVPADTDGSDARGEKGSRGVALLLAIAAVIAAIITARASLVSNDASDAWGTAVGDEQRRGALLLEQVRYTYGSEGDLAFMIASAETQADALHRAGPAQSPDVAAQVEAEAQVQDQVVDLVLPASEVASDPRYALPSGGYDLELRLADERLSNPDDVATDPPARMAEGDAAASLAERLMQTTIAVGVAFLFGALAQTTRRRRRPLLLLGWVSVAVAVVAAIVVELGSSGVIGA
jgi:hypothetical protein